MATAIVVLLTLSLACTCLASPGIIYAAAPVNRGAYHVGGLSGSYNYGYNTGDGIAKVETRSSDGSVTGSYRYFDPSGRQIIRTYIADRQGFRVLGNDLPSGPGVPATALPSAQVLTAPVEGTREFQSSSLFIPQEIEATGAKVVEDVDDSILQKAEVTNELLQKQEVLIREQQKYLDKLKEQQQKFQQLAEEELVKRQEQQTIAQMQKQQLQTEIATNLFSVPYYFHDGGIRYDFPAGFAYIGAPVVRRLSPVGVTGEHKDTPFTAGHTVSRVISLPPVAPHREYKPHFVSLTAGHTNASPVYSRPYILGHAR